MLDFLLEKFKRTFNVQLIEGDPLKNDFIKPFGISYSTEKFKLKLCTPELPINKKEFILLGGNGLLNRSQFKGLEIYTKRGLVIKWIEKQIAEESHYTRYIIQLVLNEETIGTNSLVSKSRKICAIIFREAIKTGDVAILYNSENGLKLIDEIQYFGMGIQADELAGGGGIYFVYNEKPILYYKTWMS